VSKSIYGFTKKRVPLSLMNSRNSTYGSRSSETVGLGDNFRGLLCVTDPLQCEGVDFGLRARGLARYSRAGRGYPRRSCCTASGTARVPQRALSGVQAGGVGVVVGEVRGGCECGCEYAEARWENVVVGGLRAVGASGSRRMGRTSWWEGRGGCDCDCDCKCQMCEQCKKSSSWPFGGRGSQAPGRTWVLASMRVSPGPGTLPPRGPSRSF
jgi:hypothetical protein